MPMGMTDLGHIIHAKSMFGSTFHLAWGRLPDNYPDPWNLGDTPPIPHSLIVTETVTRGATLLDQLANVGILELISVSAGGTPFTPTTDYVLNGRSVEWTSGGTKPSEGQTYTVIYRFTTTEITALLEELGRREPTIKSYCLPDEDGDIVANDTSWAVSATPTRHIYLQFKFDSSEAVGQIIHQLGLIVGTVRTAETPVGKKYLIPSEIEDQGELYMIENIEPFSRYAGKREVFEYVVTF